MTTEPTASEGRIGDCESKVYLTSHLLGDGSDDFIIIDFKPTESLAVDPTYQSVELLGQPATETLDIAHEGFLR